MKKAAAAALVAILGTLFVPAPARAEQTVTITGGGWGHGIGMSQYGAYGRALNGAGAKKILNHYYTNVSVTTRRMPSKIRVGLLQFRDAVGVTSSAFADGGGRLVWKVKGQKGRIARGGESATWRVEPSPTGGLRLFKNGSRIERGGNSVFGDPAHPLVAVYEKFGSSVALSGKDHKYPYGRVEIATHASERCGGLYCLRAIVILPMQKYLYGLGEVPSSWPRAVLKAQAIAGRTYAFDKVRRSGQHREPCDCAVFDSVLDQAYIGDSKRTGSGIYWDDWKGAVDATNRVVVLHNGDPISALYSSSSGGHTENNENVWGDGTSKTAIPYLRGVPDGTDDARGRNPNHTWSVKMSFSEFERKLNAAYGTGSLQDFELVKPFGVSGRVTVVHPDDTGGARIDGSNKNVRASGWSLRSTLSLKDSLFRVDISFPVGARFQAKYDSLDGAPGEPTSAPYDVPKGWKRPRGRAQDFQKGRMTWHKGLDRVVWQRGKVLRKYNRLGREKSFLRMPRSGIWGPGSYRGADYDRGMIVWSKDYGAHTVRGKFRTAYRRTGSVTGALGLPKREREAKDTLVGGGRRQRFDSGTLYKNPETNKVFALWDAIDARFRKMGEASSECGYPTADMVATDNGASATFEHGVISWSPAGGIDVVCS